MLLERFGSLDAIQEASASELEGAGIPRKVAQSVIRVLSENESRAVLEEQEVTDDSREGAKTLKTDV
jgi:hypothetical protein